MALPSAPWDGAALAIAPVPGWEGYGLESSVVLADNDDGTWIVTHSTLTFATSTDVGIGQGLLVWVLGPEAELPAASATAVGFVEAPWVIQEVGPLDPVCGDSARLELITAGDAPPPGTAPGAIYVDDVAFTGTVCPMFVDGDGDGRCPQGFDVDADGTCVDVAAAEPELPGVTPDCDDGVYGPSCLGLSGVRGTGLSATLTATHAGPGETVSFRWSATLGTTCPANLGGVCLGITRARVLGQRVADAAGVATFTGSTPTNGWLQAVVVRPTPGASDVSDVIAVP